MGVFDDDDDEDIVADWDAFDAVVAQHQQKKQVLEASVRYKLLAPRSYDMFLHIVYHIACCR